VNDANTELLFGIHPLYEVLRANRRKVHEVYLAQKKPSARITKLMAAAHSKGIPILTLKTSKLEALVRSDAHQGIAAKVSSFPLETFSDLWQSTVDRKGKPFWLLLDNILDPQNLGAILRTALCVGVDAVVIPKDRSASPTPAVSKASAGALEHVRLTRVTNFVRTLKQLKEKGMWIIGLDKKANQSVYAADLTGSIGLLIGGEQKGMRPLVKKQSDFLVSIPQRGPLDSLNASVAAAVTMYEALRQRITINS
jgi:23S rRNA (guanosine2251-2'-O)-methyltransferase